jgi:hypothetical protein
MEVYRQLLHLWRPDEKGFISLLDWHGVKQSTLTEEDRKVMGPGGIGYGAYLVK